MVVQTPDLLVSAAPARGIGHNQGPSMDARGTWRRYAWNRARAELLPQLPIEVVRRRVRRAGELGLDYKTYASVRAATGRDIVALLFSSNALRVLRQNDPLPQDRSAALQALRQTKIRLAVAPGLAPSALAERLEAQNALHIDLATQAPHHLEAWPGLREGMARATQGVPADGVLLIGDMSLEQVWCDAGKLAGYLPAARYFPS